MVTLFKTANPVLLLILIVVGFLLNLNLFLNDIQLSIETTAPLSKFILQQISFLPNWLLHIIFIGYIVSVGLYLSTVLAKHQLNQKYNFVPALFFVSFFSLINVHCYFSPVFICLPLFIFYLDRLFSTIFSDNNLSNSFEIGFVNGLLCMLYLPFGILIVLSLLAYIYLTNFYWRYWLSIIIGFVAAILIAFSFYLLFDIEALFLANLFGGNQSNLFTIIFNQQFIIQIACLFTTLFLMLFFRDDKMFKLTMAYKKSYLMLLVMFFVFVLLQVRHSQPSYEPLLLNFLIGIIFISTFAFQQRNEWLVNSTHVLLILAAIYIQYFAYKLI